MTKYTLVIDQGGQSTRAIVLDTKGKAVAFSSEPIDDALSSSNNLIEYDSQAIIDSTQQLLSRIPSQLTSKPSNKLRSIAIIAQRSSFLACNKQGEPLTAMISWQDTRHASWLDQQNIDQDYFQQLTGLRCNPHMGASKMRWLLDYHPLVKKHANNNDLLFIPWGAYFLFKLKQEMGSSEHPQYNSLLCDGVLAARTGLVEYGQLNWSAQLTQLFGIPKTCLPSIKPTRFDYGELILGDNAIPVTLLGGDQSFIPCAYGLKKMKKRIFLNIGTGAFVQSQCLTNKQQGLLKTAIAIEAINDPPHSKEDNNVEDKNQLNIIEGTVNAAASLLEWWLDQLETSYSYAEIDTFLETITHPPVFIQTLFGTGSPFWISGNNNTKNISKTNDSNKDIKNYFIEDEKNYSDEEKTVAVIENILFSCQINIDIILEQNPNLKKIIISGGLAKSDLLCQKLSNLSHKIIERFDDGEASARGAAFYLKQKNNYKPKTPVIKFRPSTNNPEQKSLKQRFELYKHTMKALYNKHTS